MANTIPPYIAHCMCMDNGQLGVMDDALEGGY
jgi:hypothetical protein